MLQLRYTDVIQNAANIVFLTLRAVLESKVRIGRCQLTPTLKKLSMIRLAPELRGKLKVLAASRGITMELAFAEAVDFWASHSTSMPTGKVSETAKRMKAQCGQIAGSGNERITQATLTVLDCLTLGL